VAVLPMQWWLLY